MISRNEIRKKTGQKFSKPSVKIQDQTKLGECKPRKDRTVDRFPTVLMANTFLRRVVLQKPVPFGKEVSLSQENIEGYFYFLILSRPDKIAWDITTLSKGANHCLL